MQPRRSSLGVQGAPGHNLIAATSYIRCLRGDPDMLNPRDASQRPLLTSPSDAGTNLFAVRGAGANHEDRAPHATPRSILGT